MQCTAMLNTPLNYSRAFVPTPITKTLRAMSSEDRRHPHLLMTTTFWEGWWFWDPWYLDPPRLTPFTCTLVSQPMHFLPMNGTNEPLRIDFPRYHIYMRAQNNIRIDISERKILERMNWRRPKMANNFNPRFLAIQIKKLIDVRVYNVLFEWPFSNNLKAHWMTLVVVSQHFSELQLPSHSPVVLQNPSPSAQNEPEPPKPLSQRQ